MGETSLAVIIMIMTTMSKYIKTTLWHTCRMIFNPEQNN